MTRSSRFAPALLLAAACGDPLKAPALIEEPRVIGGKVEVDAASARAWPAPGEGATVRWLVGFPAARLPVTAGLLVCPGRPQSMGCRLRGAPLRHHRHGNPLDGGAGAALRAARRGRPDRHRPCARARDPLPRGPAGAPRVHRRQRLLRPRGAHSGSASRSASPGTGPRTTTPTSRRRRSSSTASPGSPRRPPTRPAPAARGGAPDPRSQPGAAGTGSPSRPRRTIASRSPRRNGASRSSSLTSRRGATRALLRGPRGRRGGRPLGGRVGGARRRPGSRADRAFYWSAATSAAAWTGPSARCAWCREARARAERSRPAGTQERAPNRRAPDRGR
jgi:hypothetical protein